MINAIKPGGWVICMETDRVLQDAGRYFSNIDYTELKQTELYKMIWKKESEQGGRDYSTGVKIPPYMQALGLKDIQIRINDRVKFANPYADTYESVYLAMVEAKGWYREYNKDEKQKLIDIMIDKGLTRDEAERYVSNEISIHERVREGYKKEYIMEMACMPIAFGRK